MTHPTNNHRRAMRLEHVLALYGDQDGGREGLIDLLTDARHWCDRSGEDFATLDRMAQQHFLAELDDSTHHERS